MGIAIMGNERGQIGFIAPLLITELGVDMLVATYAAQRQEDITRGLLCSSSEWTTLDCSSRTRTVIASFQICIEGCWIVPPLHG
jgi:hypothetical protein